MLRLHCVKNGEKIPSTEQNPEYSSKIVFSEEVLRLRIDHTEDSGKIILVLIWEDH